jgi:hypothetical protein
MGKKTGSGSGMNNPDHISESLKNYFFKLRNLNSLMWIRDKHPGSATLRDIQRLPTTPSLSIFSLSTERLSCSTLHLKREERGVCTLVPHTPCFEAPESTKTT